ncbi:helix-turn-helix domain-containing protein [Alloiococcus sp. CFN-8]|uniref:helix-turn-helix domain-containing protein n=1 Tax=Alloiococcus sp. CFN-8 TaxID=3416081 RepID=UPI003CF6934C
MSDVKVSLGNRIKQLRKAKGISQETLALKVELDRTYIASVENGKRNISIINIQKICNGLEISLKDFFSGEEFL